MCNSADIMPEDVNGKGGRDGVDLESKDKAVGLGTVSDFIPFRIFDSLVQQLLISRL